MPPPTGTFLATVRNGVIQLPPPLKQYCEAEDLHKKRWSLFRFVVTGDDRVTMQPVLPENATTLFHASLDPDGCLRIPAELRKTVSLGEQSVMLRVENGAIGMYLRKVFETLGFRP